jgi:hypothetical protein
METLSQPAPACLLVDAHVHFHSCFDQDLFLTSAFANFRRGAAELGIDGGFLGCLLLAEMGGEHWLRRWRDGAGPGEDGAWTFERTEEEDSLLARRGEDERLLLIAGRQIRTREGLEVLALATAEEFPDGLTLGDTLTRVHWSGALPVLPWGFGKWWFYRGALVEAALRQWEGILLGDNAGRLRLAGPPRFFREAEARGVPVLPGSDPLPFPEHATRAGSYGFAAPGVSPTRPAEGLRSLAQGLRSRSEQPRTFGRCSGLLEFCRDQSALRVRKRGDTAPKAGAVEAKGAAAPSPWTR